MKNLKDKILKEVKENKPKPKWQFQLHEFLIWFGFGILITLTALVFSTVIFNFTSADWMMRRYLGLGWSRFIFMNMPYFWLIILAVLAGIAYYTFRQTKNGYQYALPLILVIIVLISVVFGWTSHRYLMAGRFIESGAEKHMPMYQRINRPKQAVWQNPEKGFLIGQVVFELTDNKFKLSDINKKVWVVSCDKCLMPKGAELNRKDRVKIIGKKVDEFVFEAKEIIMFFREREMAK